STHASMVSFSLADCRFQPRQPLQNPRKYPPAHMTYSHSRFEKVHFDTATETADLARNGARDVPARSTFGNTRAARKLGACFTVEAAASRDVSRSVAFAFAISLGSMCACSLLAQ